MIGQLPGFFQRFCSVDDGFKESGVCSPGTLFASWAGIGFDDVIHIAITLGGQVKKLEPVGRGHKIEIALGDVAHKQKLTCEELAVHLIGLNRKESTESANRLGVETFSCV